MNQAHRHRLPFGKEVTLQTYGHNKYKRTIGDMILSDGMNLNQELTKQGWCWGTGSMRQEIRCWKG
jgi:endonuclease YncB( thermonuclease family)